MAQTIWRDLGPISARGAQPLPQHAVIEAAVALGGLARGEGGPLEGAPHLHVTGEEAGLVVVDAWIGWGFG